MASYQLKSESTTEGVGFIKKDQIKAPNQSESFIINHEHLEGPHDAPEDQLINRFLQGPNQWPDPVLLPNFRKVVLQYYDKMKFLATALSRLFFEASGADWSEFENDFERPSIGLRMLHYPVQPDPVPEGQFGSAPHTDYNFLTILAQDDVGGLEILSKNSGEWISAPQLKDENTKEQALLMNLGDMSSRWTNDGLRATPHRVINRSGKDRYSVAFFWDPQLDMVVDTRRLGQRWYDADSPPKYSPITYGQYLHDMLHKNYSELEVYKGLDDTKK
eukprot:TRINITY_DN3006_c0_g1_i3.p2 TRINITY_DN3006_c0_g1~~TRINITY_DN3006_c0_g1_i3.p2  ORF type:complete len:275 (+),score=74.86 TRINITY_DN3006_c0_g1_i3:1474-2298(+)